MDGFGVKHTGSETPPGYDIHCGTQLHNHAKKQTMVQIALTGP